jgi:hypothetical protein
MVTDKAKVMKFKNINEYHLLCPKLLKWVTFPLLTNPCIEGFPRGWTKHVQISATEFFLTGGEIEGKP